MEIIPIITGTHKVEPNSKGVFIPEHTGAVTLLKSEKRNILVDVGARGYLPKIRDELKNLNLSTADIDLIILTHFHLDHAYNVSHFEKARVFGWRHEWCPNGTQRLNEYELSEIEIIQTPGHAEEHLSVVCENESGQTVVIAGDAINKKYIETGEINAFSYDDKLYHESARKVLQLADIIVPGHGELIYI